MTETIDSLEKQLSSIHTEYLTHHDKLVRLYKNLSKPAVTKINKIDKSLADKIKNIESTLYENRNTVITSLSKQNTREQTKKINDRRKKYEISALKKEIKAVESAITMLKKLSPQTPIQQKQYTAKTTTKNCPFRIKADNYKKELPLQRNALRIESMFASGDRCTLKVPKGFKNRVDALLLNGDIEYFGRCESPCPEKR